ncbi:MAG TPA: hypothetical protein PLD96_01130 [Methanothrix sp.]|nr:hypothetical protein [Methanothrix sp.]HPH48701.1 hypothetical protein [Methanothrix sp.]HPM25916.1 hypothetical protein [Methanothrix sp.]
MPSAASLSPCSLDISEAESIAQTRKHINNCRIPAGSPFVPGGVAIGFLA